MNRREQQAAEAAHWRREAKQDAARDTRRQQRNQPTPDAKERH